MITVTIESTTSCITDWLSKWRKFSKMFELIRQSQLLVYIVTCQRQPALGCVYKLVEINGQPRIKLSQDVEKVTMPGNKECFRLYGSDGHALIDLLQRKGEPIPQVGQKVLCRHPFQESKRAYVTPARVEPLMKVFWQNGRVLQKMVALDKVKERVQQSLKTLRQDHKRTLNPTPYKVSGVVYNFFF